MTLIDIIRNAKRADGSFDYEQIKARGMTMDRGQQTAMFWEFIQSTDKDVIGFICKAGSDPAARALVLSIARDNGFALSEGMLDMFIKQRS